MSVSNLTNTKWRFNDTLNFTNTYTQTFSIDFWNAGGVGMWYKQLRLFYASGEGFGNRLDYCSKSSGNWEAVYGYSPAWRGEEDKNIFIRGGTDVTNAGLIAWLEANATQIELGVNDLTNTVWHFNKELLIPYLVYIPSIQEYGIKTFNLNFEYNNQQYTSLRWWQDTDFGRMSLDFGETYIADDGDEVDLFIKVSGGTDATDPFLINFLIENAQQIKYKTFDLSTLQLSAGTHTIQVRARAQNYRDSNFSNSVSYVVAQPSGGTVAFTFEDLQAGSKDYIKIYDGQDDTGTLLFESEGQVATPSPTLTCTTGYLFVGIHGAVASIKNITLSENITLVVDSLTPEDFDGDDWIVLKVDGNGTVSAVLDWSD